MSPKLIRFETKLLNDVPSLMAIRAAFRFGLFRILQQGPATALDLRSRAGLSPKGLEMLLRILQSHKMAKEKQGAWCLTRKMQALLADGGEDLRVKADFTASSVCDVLGMSELLLSSPEGFLQSAQTFRFFQYDRALGTGAANLQDTAPWVNYVSALTAREAPVLAPLIDLSNSHHILEVGGNVGIFAQSLLALNPDLSATVLDLPAVCHLGEARLKSENNAPPIAFLAGDARAIDWPDTDTVLFKSVLHDWSEEGAATMLLKASAHVPIGGRVIICERGPFAEETDIQGAQSAANLVFGQYYRDQQFYRDVLTGAGLRLAEPISVKLDMRFHITIAERVA